MVYNQIVTWTAFAILAVFIPKERVLGLKTLKPYHVCIHTGSQPHGALALTLLLLLAVPESLLSLQQREQPSVPGNFENLSTETEIPAPERFHNKRESGLVLYYFHYMS